MCVFLSAGCTGDRQVDSPGSVAATAKIAPILANAARQLGTGNGQAQLDGPVRSDSQGRIQVYIYVVTTSAEVVSTLKAQGLQNVVVSPAMQIVQGWVKPKDLDKLATLPFVTRITPPTYAYPR
ncbi:MAG: hypothetical protein ACRESE_02600 [Gammaproteobacteria bacterium]